MKQQLSFDEFKAAMAKEEAFLNMQTVEKLHKGSDGFWHFERKGERYIFNERGAVAIKRDMLQPQRLQGRIQVNLQELDLNLLWAAVEAYFIRHPKPRKCNNPKP